MTTQPSGLLRFIQSVNISNQGEIIRNVLDTEEPNFVSRYYTPKLTVTGVSKKVQAKINTGEIKQNNKRLTNNTLTIHLMNSDLKLSRPYLYTVAQGIILDAFAIVYTIEEDKDLLAEVEQRELTQTRTNIRYLIDALGGEEKYQEIVKGFHELNVAIGYIENQLPILKEGEHGTL